LHVLRNRCPYPLGRLFCKNDPWFRRGEPIEPSTHFGPGTGAAGNGCICFGIVVRIPLRRVFYKNDPGSDAVNQENQEQTKTRPEKMPEQHPHVPRKGLHMSRTRCRYFPGSCFRTPGSAAVNQENQEQTKTRPDEMSEQHPHVPRKGLHMFRTQNPWFSRGKPIEPGANQDGA
jgi:hypothetical protein